MSFSKAAPRGAAQGPSSIQIVLWAIAAGAIAICLAISARSSTADMLSCRSPDAMHTADAASRPYVGDAPLREDPPPAPKH